MLNTLNSIKIILLSYGLLFLAQGLFTTLVSVRAGIEPFSMLEIGWIMSSYFVGLLSSAFVAPRFLPRFGYARSFIIFVLAIALLSLMFQAFLLAYAWIALRFLVGFCLGTLIVITESWINSCSRNEIRGRILSVYMLVNNLALGVGQLLFSVADPAGNGLFILASMVFIAAAFPLLVVDPKEPAPPSHAQVSIVAVMRGAPLGMLGAFVAGVVNASLFSLGPIYAQSAGLSYANIGVFMAFATIGGLLLQWPIGRLSDGIDRRYPFLISLFGSAALGVCLILVDSGVLWLRFLLSALYGALSMTLSPLVSSYTNDLFHGAGASGVASAILMAYGCGAIVGPLLASLSMNHFGGDGLFVSNVVAFSLFGCYVLVSLLRTGRHISVVVSAEPLVDDVA